MQMLKSLSKWSNSGHIFPFDVLQIRLDYDACQRDILCRPVLTCFHGGFRPANSLVQLPLMHVKRWRTTCCSIWMRAKAVWETFGSPKKIIFPLNCFLNKQKWCVCGTWNLSVSKQLTPQNHGLNHGLLHFFDADRLRQRSIWTFCGELWLYKMPCSIIVVHARGCPSTSNATSLIFSTNILMIVSLHWIIASIRETTSNSLPISQILLPVTFFSLCVWGGGAVTWKTKCIA